MSEPSSPSVVKWPFLLADFCVLVVAAVLAWLAHTRELPWSLGLAAVIAASVAAGAWILVTPFLRDQDARLKLREQAGLADTVTQIRQVERVVSSVVAASTQIASSQVGLTQANAAAQSLVGVMHEERQAFMEFIQRRDDQERQTMRLELDKLRRGEEETLKVICHLLDHNYAVFLAGQRSGQPAVAQQLAAYRAACLDSVRRLGIVAHEATVGEGFNPDFHQTWDGQPPAAGSRISGTLACGYTIRSLPVRPIIVAVDTAVETAAENTIPDAGAPAIPTTIGDSAS